MLLVGQLFSLPVTSTGTSTGIGKLFYPRITWNIFTVSGGLYCYEIAADFHIGIIEHIILCVFISKLLFENGTLLRKCWWVYRIHSSQNSLILNLFWVNVQDNKNAFSLAALGRRPDAVKCITQMFLDSCTVGWRFPGWIDVTVFASLAFQHLNPVIRLIIKNNNNNNHDNVYGAVIMT